MDARELVEFLRDYEADDGDIDRSYTDLRNAVIDYENETKDWQFDGLFDDFVDDYLIAEQVKDWADEYEWGMICNYLENADNSGINRVNAYGWLEYVNASDLDEIRDEILFRLGDEAEEESEEDYE